MVSVKSALMIGGIIALTLMLRVSCDTKFEKMEMMELPEVIPEVSGNKKFILTLEILDEDEEDFADKEHPELLPAPHALTSGRKEYFASTYENNWKGALMDCKSEGYEFAFPRSIEDAKEINDLIRHMGWLETKFWIGGCSRVSWMHCPTECTEVSVNFFNHLWTLEVSDGVECSKKNRFICRL